MKMNKKESSNIDSWKYFKLKPPKIYYFISEDGDMWSEEDLDGTLELKKKMIGNYFESEEEVRKAYKKLMAWKRLKDNGFKFDYESWKNGPLDVIKYDYDLEKMESVYKDLEIILKEEE